MVDIYKQLKDDSAPFKEGSYILQEHLGEAERKFGPVAARKPKPPEPDGNMSSSKLFQHPFLGDQPQFAGNFTDNNPVVENNNEAQLDLEEVQIESLKDNPQLQNRLSLAQKMELANKLRNQPTPTFNPRMAPLGG